MILEPGTPPPELHPPATKRRATSGGRRARGNGRIADGTYPARAADGPRRGRGALAPLSSTYSCGPSRRALPVVVVAMVAVVVPVMVTTMMAGRLDLAGLRRVHRLRAGRVDVGELGLQGSTSCRRRGTWR